MRRAAKVKGGEDERARARLLTFFEDNAEAVFYGRQLEIMFEDEHFHWVTNRAINRLLDEGRIIGEKRQLSIGSMVNLLWHKKFRFYRRAASEVFDLVNKYATAASEGALGIQGEMMVVRAFARQRFTLVGEEVNSYGGRDWTDLILFSKETVSPSALR